MTLRLGFYPYTYARVAVMKSDLVKPAEWHGMLKMGVNELLRMLQDGNYRAEIDELAGKRDLASLEIALNKNMMRTLAKLKRISDEKVQEVLKVYVLRYDMENFKTIIRGKLTGISNEEIEQLLLPSINYAPAFFVELLKKEKIPDIIHALPPELVAGEILAGEPDIFEIENKLDRIYADKLIDLSKRLSGQGKAFKNFLNAELDILNIKIILRLKHEGMEKKEMLRYVLYPRAEIAQLIEKEGVQEIVDALVSMKIIARAAPEAELFTQAETGLDTALLKKEVLLMHQFPLTVNVILGFMFAKEIEVKNLKVLLKGKQLGIDDEYLERLMAVA
ncbi:V-type ATPase subunit [Candidatus Woesearchaeota archaeon]|nr:V-type ATPase subunit [Candidatus Woesearchaeota archaeon]